MRFHVAVAAKNQPVLFIGYFLGLIHRNVNTSIYLQYKASGVHK